MPSPPAYPAARAARMALVSGFALALSLPVSAQVPTVPAPQDTPETAPQTQGKSLIEQGAMMLFQGIMTEMAPAINDMTNDMRQTTQTLWPAMQDLARLMDDIGNYEMPERLENGDIVIRRSAGAPPPPPVGEDLQRLLPRRDDAPPAPADGADPADQKTDL